MYPTVADVDNRVTIWTIALLLTALLVLLSVLLGSAVMVGQSMCASPVPSALERRLPSSQALTDNPPQWPTPVALR